MFKNPIVKQVIITLAVIIVFRYVVKEYNKMKAAKAADSGAKVVEMNEYAEAI